MRPLLWHGAKTMDLDAIATGLNILTDMAYPNVKFRDVLRRKVSELAHRELKRMSGQGRKSKRAKGVGTTFER